MKHKSLNQLLCAAVINGRFRETLLRDPLRALAAGYEGHEFDLTPEERALVVGIRAHGLEDFAAQVHCWISGEGQEFEPQRVPESMPATGNRSGFRPALVPVYA